MEKSSASEMFMVIMRIMTDRPMFTTSRISRMAGFSGTNRNMTTTTTNSAMLLFRMRLSIDLPPGGTQLYCHHFTICFFSFSLKIYTRTSATGPYRSGGINWFNSD